MGLDEVNLKLLDENLGVFKRNPGQAIRKPLVVFAEDRITRETLDPAAFPLGIAEGTYTTLLKNVDIRIFIDRSFEQTLQDREERKRDKIDNVSEQILKIEHGIISKHKSMADILIEQDYSINVVNPDFQHLEGKR